MITSDDDNIEHEQQASQLFSEHFALKSPVIIMKIARTH